MKPNEELIGKTAELPGGQKVVIEKVEDGLVTARRIGGEFKGMIVVCAIESLTAIRPRLALPLAS